MNYFTHILLNNALPIAILIAAGITLQRIFQLDIRTLSKLNFYVFSPVVIFKMLYEASVSAAILMDVLLFFFVFIALLYALTLLVLRFRKPSKSMKTAMVNSVIFYNSANFALPLNQLVFLGDPFTLSIQIIIMMMQSLLPNTVGVYSVNAQKSDIRKIMKTIAGLPVIYAIPLAFVMRGFQIPIPEPLYVPINYIAGAFIATALLTLGVQLGSIKWRLNLSDVLISNSLRLLAAPLLGYFVVLLLGIEGMMAKALVLSCAVPTSLNSMLLAVEFDNEPEFASQAVFSSTMLSIVTVSVVIYLLQYVG